MTDDATISPTDAATLDQAIEEAVDTRVLVSKIANAVYDRWVELARELPGRSGAEYVKSIKKPVLTSDTSAVVELVGVRPLAIEDGAPAYDMKASLKGQYIVIPFDDGGDVEFRTLSKNSPAGSWIRKAQPGKLLADQVKREMQALVDKIQVE